MFIITTEPDRVKVSAYHGAFLLRRKSSCKVSCTRIFKHIIHKLLARSTFRHEALGLSYRGS
jgi:hypothetical protein